MKKSVRPQILHKPCLPLLVLSPTTPMQPERKELLVKTPTAAAQCSLRPEKAARPLQTHLNLRSSLAGVCLILLFLFAPLLLCAQSQADNRTRYQNAKVLLEQSRYDLAMAELLPLTQSSPQNPLAAEASYLYAVAAYRAGKMPEATTMLAQLQDQHPNWPSRHEATYLQANIAFEKGEYLKALQLLQNLPASTLSAESQALKAHYLSKVSNRTTLDYLHRQLSQDKDVAQALADLLLATYTPADKVQLEQLVQQYQLDPKRYTTARTYTPKSQIRVAVLFPFGYDKTAKSVSKKNQFVHDLYQGIRYAADSLQKRGLRVELFAYEVGTDTMALRQLTQQPELQTMDLIIGPVYKTRSKAIASFANQYKIPVINPLSEDGELVRNNPYVYLFEASQQTKANQLAKFTFENYQPTNGVVIYEDRREDSTFAQLYRQAYEALGGKITAMRKVSGKKNASQAAQLKDLDLTEVGHLVAATESPFAAVHIMSMLDHKAAMQPVFVPAAWLEFQQISLQQLDARNIYFWHPHFLNPDRPGISTFRKGYQSRQHIPPSQYAMTGFEIMYFFGNALRQFGSDLQAGLATTSFREGALYPGYNYTTGNDNQYLPLYKLEELRLVRANSPYDYKTTIPEPLIDEKK